MNNCWISKLKSKIHFGGKSGFINPVKNEVPKPLSTQLLRNQWISLLCAWHPNRGSLMTFALKYNFKVCVLQKTRVQICLWLKTTATQVYLQPLWKMKKFLFQSASLKIQCHSVEFGRVKRTRKMKSCCVLYHD